MDRQLYCFDYLHAGVEEVAALLLADPETFIQTATDAAAQHGEEVLANLSIDVGGFEVGREVRITVDAVERPDAQRVVLPLRWEAVKASSLFPQMVARLEIVSLTKAPPRSQIMFFGSYEPPAGVVGAVGDAIAMHRVAEATVHRFLADVTERLRMGISERRTRPIAPS